MFNPINHEDPIPLDNNNFVVNKLCADVVKFGFIMALIKKDKISKNNEKILNSGIKSKSIKGGEIENQEKINTNEFEIAKSVHSEYSSISNKNATNNSESTPVLDSNNMKQYVL